MGLVVGGVGLVITLVLIFSLLQITFLGRKPWNARTRHPSVSELVSDGWKIDNVAVALKNISFPMLLKGFENRESSINGYNLLDVIKEHEDELVRYIKQNEDCSEALVGCGRCGADWLLQRDVVSDELVESLIKQSHDKELWEEPTLALIYIEGLARKDGQLIPDIITALRENGAIFAECNLIDYDDRIIDYEIEHTILGLEAPFIEIDDYASTSLSGLFIEHHKMGYGMEIAELIIKYPKHEREIREIVPHVLNQVVDWKIHKKFHDTDGVLDIMRDWCVKNETILGPYLVEGLKHESEIARLFVANCLSKIGDKYFEALSSLKNDPDPNVRNAVEDVLKR